MCHSVRASVPQWGASVLEWGLVLSSQCCCGGCDALQWCVCAVRQVYFVWVKKEGGDSREVWSSEELEGLHRATLASMQAEIDQLRSEVDSYKVGGVNNVEELMSWVGPMGWWGMTVCHV